jgi:hypothetical protein
MNGDYQIIIDIRQIQYFSKNKFILIISIITNDI